jgi:ATP-binding cassette subfamily B protein
MVPQDTVLFHRSIKENIAYGNPDASDEEIFAAAKMARCHEFISKLSHGYDTTVGER